MAPESQSASQSAEERRYEQAFWLDLENWALQHRWDARIGIPCGPRRHLDTAWRTIMLQELEAYPRNTIEQYEAFVLSGQGDDWFLEDAEITGEITYRSHAPSDYIQFSSFVNGEHATNIRRIWETGRSSLQECGAAQRGVHHAGGG